MPCEDALVLAFVAAALKFTAVPAAAFELLSAQRRTAIEAWLFGKLPKLVATFMATLFMLFISVALLVKAGPYLLLIYFLFYGVISLAILLYWDAEKFLAYHVVGIVLSIAITVAAALEKWVIPEAWVVAMGHPFEVVSEWANTSPFIDWFLPDYSVQAFRENFRGVFHRIEEWLWDWLAFLYGAYFFLTRGAMLLMIALIQLLLVVGIVVGVIVVLAIPPSLFMKFSDCVRQKLHIDKDRIPVGAFFFWATGETIEFGMRAQETFWK
jgi:hypothetical protein